MYQIYALIDPRNNRAFYIGATSRKLEYRLKEHVKTKKPVNESHSFVAERVNRISEILNEQLFPKIRLLTVCEAEKVDELEREYHRRFWRSGCRLLQDGASRFHYSKTNIK